MLTGERYYNNADVYVSALGFVKHMRDYCEFLRKEYNLNFSLLATSGELISGRFIDMDRTEFTPSAQIFEKSFTQILSILTLIVICLRLGKFN